MSEPPVQPTQEDPFQGLIRGVQNLIQSVARATESGAQRIRQGAFPQGTGLQGVYGFTIKADLAKPSLTIEVGQVPDRDIIVPRIEQIDEPDMLRLVAEMPGVSANDIRVTVEGATLHINAEKGERKYRRSIPLSFVPLEGAVEHSCTDGIVEIRVRKPGTT